MGARPQSLLASPIRRPLFGERARAFTSVLGSLQPAIQFALEFEPVGEREVEAAQGRLLDTRNRERRALADLARDLLAFADELTYRHNVIDEAKPQSLFGTDTIPGIEHLQRAAQRNQTRQALRTASTGQLSQSHLTEAELSMFGGDADVASERLLEAATIRVAIDGGDDWLVEVVHHGKRRVRRILAGLRDVVVLDVTARTKCAVSRARHDGDAQRGVVAKLTPDLREASIRFEVTGVQPLGPVDGDVGDWSFLFE